MTMPTLAWHKEEHPRVRVSWVPYWERRPYISGCKKQHGKRGACPSGPFFMRARAQGPQRSANPPSVLATAGALSFKSYARPSADTLAKAALLRTST